MAKVVSFSNQKGGVGKTTSCVNIAAAVGAMGYRVLLCDLDPQGNATSGVGVSKKALRHSACLNLYHFIHPPTLTSSHQGTLSNYPPSHWKDMVFLDFSFLSIIT